MTNKASAESPEASMQPFQRQLQHLQELARKPGFKAHAWSRAKELDTDTSGLFAGMAAALEREMTAASPMPTKRR